MEEHAVARKIGVSMDGLQAAAEVAAGLRGERDEIHEDLVSKSPAMFTDEAEKLAQRKEELYSTLEAAGNAGMPEQTLERLQDLVMDRQLGVFRRALTGEPPAEVEPLRVTLRQGADLRKFKAKCRSMKPERVSWLEEQMGRLEAARMVYPNPQATCASVAMAVPKAGGTSYRMVADYRAANEQMELVPWPMPRVEEATALFQGVPAFCSLDLLQGYWQIDAVECGEPGAVHYRVTFWAVHVG